jgi:RNA polymerase sigma-70 factor (ECF subfamily)
MTRAGRGPARPVRYLKGVATATRSRSGPSDAALVVAARAGEAWAQESLFRRYRQMVYGLALRLTGGTVHVDDLVQESFVRALRSLHKLKDPQSFARWLGTIVVFTASKMRRHERMLARLGLSHPDPVDIDSMIARTAPPDIAMDLRGVYALLDVLPVEAHIALILRRVEGMGLDEIAEHMKLSIATVKRRLALAERHLAEGTLEKSGARRRQ